MNTAIQKRVSTACFILSVSFLAACTGSHAWMKTATPDQIAGQSAENLCSSYGKSRRIGERPIAAVDAEVRKRGLDCSDRVAFEQRGYFEPGQQPPTQTVSARSKAQAPIHCGQPISPGLSAAQAKAVLFEFYKKTRSKSFICVDRIEVTDKFALRGNTVITYTATVSFPNGYKTHCIGHRPKTKGPLDLQDLLKTTTGGCNQFSQYLRGLGKPARPGERRTYSDEVTI